MTLLRWFLLLVMITGVAAFSWLHAQARADPIVRTARIGFHDWPRGKPPVGVVLLSDIHLGNLTMDAARLRRIAGQVDALKPDAIVIAGDFVAGHDKVSARRMARDVVAPMSAFRAPLGVFAVLGNHDEWTQPHLLDQALASAGVRVLHDDAVQAGPLVVVGFNDLYTVGPHVDATLRKMRGLTGVPIALTHGDYRDYLKGRIQLMLVGHTHCAQINLIPFGIHNPYFEGRYPCGLARDRFGVTVTTAGLGTSILPLRFNAPPDLWVLTLGPAAAASGGRPPA